MKYVPNILKIIIFLSIIVLFIHLYNNFFIKNTEIDNKSKINLNNTLKPSLVEKIYQEFNLSSLGNINILAFEELISKLDSKFLWHYNHKEYKQNSEKLNNIFNTFVEDAKNINYETLNIPSGYRIKWGNFIFKDKENNEYIFITENISKDDYLLINNEKFINLGKIINGADGGIKNFEIINDKISFLYRKSDMSKEESKTLYDCYERNSDIGNTEEKCGKEKFYWEAFYGEADISKILEISYITKIFEYKGKIGFVGSKKNKYFVYFDNKQISKSFDEIRFLSCCDIPSFPFKIYENGILNFLGKRNNHYFLVEVNLENL